MRLTDGLTETIRGLATKWRLHVFAAIWLVAIGAMAFGLSKLAPEGEAAGGVVLAAIALGAYRLSGWALDLLGSIVVELLVWPLLKLGDRARDMEGAAFASAVRMLDSEGRDPHFAKLHPLHEEMRDVRRDLEKIARSAERIARQSDVRKRAFASVTPRKHVLVESMLDLSAVASEEELGDGAFNGAVFEMPDGTYWEIPGGNATFVSALDGVEGSRFIQLRRVDR
ncbi:MAG: hypothetical protein OXN86_10920 [Chloroflexota bacterium]|nr:hypothetical protein [Rhodospirillaceae bacterium]MDE2747116.1 hypothetical protein [Chloroflexota bacterium]MDE2893002.1 hypothetical protein [Chloroflexota bacterium]MXX48334.1 hypothetical protein [Chloroflexota bacterium]MXY85644.1 hypothetical protein [Chloroflexota bacterium]